MRNKKFIIISIIILGVLAFSNVFDRAELVRAISQEGLVGWWKMDDNLGTTVVVDETGTNNGTFNDTTGDPNTNAHSAVSLHDRALTFDGTDDYVDCGNDAGLSPSNYITVEAWVYPSVTAGNEFFIFGNYYSSLKKGYGLLIQYEDVRFYWGDGTTLHYTGTNNDSIPANSRYHIVGIYNDSHLIVYVNGVEVTSTNIGSISLVRNNENNICIGRRWGTYQPFNGQIDQVRIYNRALSAEEITLHYFLESETRIKGAELRNCEIK